MSLAPRSENLQFVAATCRRSAAVTVLYSGGCLDSRPPNARGSHRGVGAGQYRHRMTHIIQFRWPGAQSTPAIAGLARDDQRLPSAGAGGWTLTYTVTFANPHAALAANLTLNVRLGEISISRPGTSPCSVESSA